MFKKAEIARWKSIATLFVFGMLLSGMQHREAPIDRLELISRHHVNNDGIDSLSALTVGNGAFAFTVDVTGLQTFPEAYAKGVPLGTQATWGWHGPVNRDSFLFEETMRYVDFANTGMPVSYPIQWGDDEPRRQNAANWFRKSPHRLQLGNVGFDMYREDGSLVEIGDLSSIKQQLNLWTGEIHSHFEVCGYPVSVITTAHYEQDVIAAQVKSPLIALGRLRIRIRYPYPSLGFFDNGTEWEHPRQHQSAVLMSSKGDALLSHQLDNTVYYTAVGWDGEAKLRTETQHYYQIVPDTLTDEFEVSVLFSPTKPKMGDVPAYPICRTSSNEGWREFWLGGAAIDFAGSTDSRAHELERRVVLSQYLTRVQCAGTVPPQETGLTYSSWFGKAHLEMHWWHAVHYALWGRISLLEQSLGWYRDIAPKAMEIAERQGYEGLRWPKMVDNSGQESPSSIAPFLIWQQPHFIYFAELVYREYPNSQTLDRFSDLVFATADFMADFPVYDAEKGRYDLTGIIPAQEIFQPDSTSNPTFELAYWDWGLRIAQQWRERCGLPRKSEWDDVIGKLAPLPVYQDVYLSIEDITESFTDSRYTVDHPTVLGAFGMLPESMKLNRSTMYTTFERVWDNWQWEQTWGWDFPMVAMTAARLGNPQKALDALLMDVQTNRYLHNGHNYQNENLSIYLPGNGGLLTAVAMMAEGWDGIDRVFPGFPKDGSWCIKKEGFRKMM